VGASVNTVWGQATAGFQPEPLNADAILAALNGDDPRFSFGGIQVGADLRIGNRIGFSSYLETLPDMRDHRNIGTYTRVIVGFHSWGNEVTFWF
jgi:hypothetical protein